MSITNNGAGLTAFVLLNLNGIVNQRTPAISGGKISIGPSDNILYINNQTAAAMSVDLGNHDPTFQLLFIKDIAGNAGTYAITVSGTVDGTANPVFQVNYGGALLSWNGSSWSEHA